MPQKPKRKLNTAIGFAMTLLACGLLLSACSNSEETTPPDGDLDGEQVEDGDATDQDLGDGDIDSGRCPAGMAWDALRQQCRPKTDGDLDHDADNGGDADTIDSDQDAEPDIDSTAVTKEFSHNMDADDPLLLPGEIRVTAGESGVLASFVQYDIGKDELVYCGNNTSVTYCSTEGKDCYKYKYKYDISKCYYPSIANSVIAFATYSIQSRSELKAANYKVILLNQPDMTFVELDKAVRHIAASNHWVIWIESNGSLYLLDINNLNYSTIYQTQFDYILSPGLAGEFAIWVHADNESFVPSSILIKNLKSNNTTTVNTSEEFRLCDSEISDQGAVWIEDCLALDDPTADGRLIYYDLQSETKSEIDPQPHPKDNPAIDGTKIVWTDFRNGSITSSSNYQNADIYLHDLSKNQTVPISTAPGNQFWPRISGRYVIYEDTRWNRTPHDIVLFDLCTLEMYADDAMCAD